MTGTELELFLGIGIVSGALAALLAYFITYGEWSRHYPTKREPRKMALEAAVFAFVVFFIISLAAGYVLTAHPTFR